MRLEEKTNGPGSKAVNGGKNILAIAPDDASAAKKIQQQSGVNLFGSDAQNALVQAPTFVSTPLNNESVHGLFSLSPELFKAQVQQDAMLMASSMDALNRIFTEVSRRENLFTISLKTPYEPTERRELIGLWAALHDHIFALETLRQRYWDFVKDPNFKSEKHSLGYLMTHAALTTQLAHGVKFVRDVQKNEQLKQLFNEPLPEYGIMPGSFDHLSKHVVHVNTATQLATGNLYGKWVMKKVLEKQGHLEAGGITAKIADEMEFNGKMAQTILTEKHRTLFLRSAAQLIGNKIKGAAMKPQIQIAMLISNTKLRRKGEYLIKLEQVHKLQERMEPGDIMVSRQNWYPSNLALPGFWKHGVLYLGSSQQFCNYYDNDAEVNAFIKEKSNGKFTKLSDYLKAAYPEKWDTYCNGVDFQGNAIRLMEAIGRGVVFSGVEHGMVVDYLAVMRPMLSKAEKAEAMIRAFEDQGKPYNYEFDIRTDQAIFCTQLLERCYQKDGKGKGLFMEPVSVAGRPTYPANILVRDFANDYGTSRQQLEFVGMLKGNEHEGNASEVDVRTFMESCTLPNWDILQE